MKWFEVVPFNILRRLLMTPTVSLSGCAAKGLEPPGSLPDVRLQKGLSWDLPV